jgi:hypothetical protein
VIAEYWQQVMSSFVAVGGGEPAHAVLKTRSAQRAGNVVALFTASAMSSRQVNLGEPEDSGVFAWCPCGSRSGPFGNKSEHRLASKCK